MSDFKSLSNRITFDNNILLNLSENEYNLVLYFLLNESGAVCVWRETYDYYHNTNRIKTEFSDYICDSEYDSYCRYMELVKWLTKSYPYLKFERIVYSDYINKMTD